MIGNSEPELLYDVRTCVSSWGSLDDVVNAVVGATNRSTGIKMEILAMLMMNLVKEEEQVDSTRQKEISNWDIILCKD